MIQLQQAADDANRKVRELQERFGPPSAGDGWTEEQHTEWQTLWEAWREAATAARTTIPHTLEMAVKKIVRHLESEADAA